MCSSPERDLTFAISIAIVAFRILLTFVAANANSSLAITFESAWTISVHRDILLFKHDSLILYLLAFYLLPFVYAIYAFTFSW